MSESPPGPRIARVPEAAEGERLDRFLTEHFPNYSRKQVAEVVRSGAVRVNGRPGRAGTRLKAGDKLELPRMSDAVRDVVRARRRRERLRQSTRVSGEVVELHRDDDLLVVSKPPGVPVHGGAALGQTETLVDLLKEDVLQGFGLVHRIDRDTSGAVALVRGEALRKVTAAAFAELEGGVEKRYEAIVEGLPEPEAGEIDLPLLPPGHGGRARVDPKGKPSRTQYLTLERFREAARVSLVPWTGRTHQIRVHLAAAGWPLLVDPAYGSRGGWMLRDPRGRLDARLRRTPLHAAELVLPHPRTGAVVRVEAPLAPDMRYALEVLRVDAATRGS